MRAPTRRRRRRGSCNGSWNLRPSDRPQGRLGADLAVGLRRVLERSPVLGIVTEHDRRAGLVGQFM